MLLYPPGAMRIDASWSPNGPATRVARTVSPRIGIAATSSSASPFDLEAKIVVIEQLVPLFVAGTLGTEGIGILATLFFGPVRIDGERVWGRAARRWGSVQLSTGPLLSMLAGVEERENAIEPFAGVRLFPSGHGLWEIGVSVRRDGIGLSVGGALW